MKIVNEKKLFFCLKVVFSTFFNLWSLTFSKTNSNCICKFFLKMWSLTENYHSQLTGSSPFLYSTSCQHSRTSQILGSIQQGKGFHHMAPEALRWLPVKKPGQVNTGKPSCLQRKPWRLTNIKALPAFNNFHCLCFFQDHS